jgi:transketolase N-terminal domain/subunit
MWPLVNGVALANRDKVLFCLGSDGSQQEGNDAEAARLAVAQGLNVKLLIGALSFSSRAGCVCC